MASLVITDGEQAGAQFKLASRTLAGGRDPTREIQIIDPLVSRKHFLVRKEGDYHIIAETHAKNGVLVNGEKVAQRVLQDGDRIQVGSTQLIYYVDDDPDLSDAVQKQRRADRALREDRTFTE